MGKLRFMYIKIWWLPLFLMAVITSCMTEKQVSISPVAESNVQKLPEDDPRKRVTTEKFIEATKMEILGDYQQALNLYKEVIKIDPANDAAYYNMAKILYTSKQYVDAASYAQQAAKLDPENVWYLDLYGTLLGGLGNYKEAQKVYEQMAKLQPDNPDAWFNWAFFTEQNKQYDEAISIFNEFEERFGYMEEVTGEKVKLWMQLGKKDKAAEEIQKLINANPGDPKYYGMLVDFYMSNRMDEKAFETLQQLIQLNPSDPKSSILLAGYYQRKGDDAKADAEFRKVFSNPDLDEDFAIPVLMSYLPHFQNPGDTSSEERERGITYARLFAESHPQSAKAHAMYADLLYQDDQFDAALTEYKKSLEITSSVFLVWQQVFFIYDHQRNYDSLAAVSERAMNLFPDQAMAYYFNGYAHMQMKEYDAAISSLTRAADIGGGDRRFASQVYASLGDIYYNQKNHHASDSCYEMALVFDPSNAYVLNNYSYFLSLRGEKLDEALEMAERANILSPNNAAYEDTYGWVLFKVGKYNEAKDWIEKALKHGAVTDGTVLEHYGDILFKLGDVDGAVEYWLKAKDRNVESETIDRKIAGRKFYE